MGIVNSILSFVWFMLLWCIGGAIGLSARAQIEKRKHRN